VQTVQARHAKVELVAQQNDVVPGQPLWLAVHYSLEKDWHIYWINPGDSGQPPVLRWQLPQGFSAGEIRWPRPEKLRRSTLADYGYKDDAVLLVPIRVPAHLKQGTNVNLQLQAKWLICADVCIPDHADLHLDLPVSSASARPQNQSALVEQARHRLPRLWPYKWKASATSDKDDFLLTITTGKPIQAAEFFPLEPEQIENAAPQPLETSAQGARVHLKKSDQLLKPIPVLKGLLVLSDGTSYQVAAPVTQAHAKAHNN